MRINSRLFQGNQIQRQEVNAMASSNTDYTCTGVTLSRKTCRTKTKGTLNELLVQRPFCKQSGETSAFHAINDIYRQMHGPALQFNRAVTSDILVAFPTRRSMMQ